MSKLDEYLKKGKNSTNYKTTDFSVDDLPEGSFERFCAMVVETISFAIDQWDISEEDMQDENGEITVKSVTKGMKEMLPLTIESIDDDEFEELKEEENFENRVIKKVGKICTDLVINAYKRSGEIK